MTKPRPKYLNLPAIRLPLPGILSIFHRISGALLIIALPFALWALDLSVASEESYAQVAKCLSHPFIKLCVWGAAWALFHHSCAGARFLLLDFHIGASLPAARFSAGLAFAASIVMTIAFGVWLW
ncbi:MAG: succinate dehydrogenase, cytochrome b556 subunit [Gammaproteobacteria bacterium]